MELLLTNLSSGKPRTETRNGREYLVTTLTTIVPGVLPGSKGDLYYPPNEIARNVKDWDQTPLVVYHPTDELGRNISAKSKKVLANSGVGFVEKSKYKGKLQHEGWFDVQKVTNYDKKLSPENKLLPRIKAGKAIELSTGLFTENEKAPEGSIAPDGRAYSAIARNYRPDHIAILPDQVGACSLNDGCGVNVNAKRVDDMAGKKTDDAAATLIGPPNKKGDDGRDLITPKRAKNKLLEEENDSDEEVEEVTPDEGNLRSNAKVCPVCGKMIDNCGCTRNEADDDDDEDRRPATNSWEDFITRNVWTEQARMAAAATKKAEAAARKGSSDSPEEGGGGGHAQQATTLASGASLAAGTSGQNLAGLAGAAEAAQQAYKVAAYAHEVAGKAHEAEGNDKVAKHHQKAAEAHHKASDVIAKEHLAKKAPTTNTISHDDLRSRLHAKLRTKFTQNEDYPYIRDVYPDHFVYIHQGQLHKQGYALDSDDGVTLKGSAQKVMQKTVYEPMGKSDGKQKVTFNTSTGETQMGKTELITFLVTNCDCWKDGGDVLANLDEKRLQKLKSAYDTAKKNELIANKKGGKAEGSNADVKDDPETAAAEAKKTAEEEKGNDFKGKGKKKVTTNEWMQDQPPEVQEAVTNAIRISHNEKTQLITQLTANVADEEVKKQLIETYSAMKNDQLRLMAAAHAPTANNQNIGDYRYPSEGFPSYLGGGAGGPVYNGGRAMPKCDDILETPVLFAPVETKPIGSKA